MFSDTKTVTMKKAQETIGDGGDEGVLNAGGPTARGYMKARTDPAIQIILPLGLERTRRRACLIQFESRNARGPGLAWKNACGPVRRPVLRQGKQGWRGRVKRVPLSDSPP